MYDPQQYGCPVVCVVRVSWTEGRWSREYFIPEGQLSTFLVLLAFVLLVQLLLVH